MNKLARNFWTSILLALSDFFSFVLAAYFSIFVNTHLTNNAIHILVDSQINDWLTLHYFLGLFCVCWFSIRLRHYFYRKTFWFELKEILRTLVIFFVIEASVIAFARWLIPYSLLIITWFGAFFLVPFLRMFTKRLLNFLNMWKRDTIIIGSGNNALEAWKAISEESNLGFEVVSFFESQERNSISKFTPGIPVLNITPENFSSKFDKRIQFIVALESNESDLRNDWLRTFMINGYRYVSVIPTLRGMPLDSTDMSFVFSHEVMIFRVHHNLAKTSSRILKRIFDIVGSIAIISLIFPLLIYIAYRIKSDNGNIIYGHERIGKNGKAFKCLKFRSMVTNSQEVLQHLLDNNPAAREEWNVSFKLKNDPRVTPIGHFLRKTSLDELPQLFNVLKGDMSLVGPRPIIAEELSRYSDKKDYYLLSKPGMTGLWQVSGRSDVDYETRVYFDAWYVKNWSMWNDIAILFKTVGVVLNRNGAY
ncbi:undecaprenyl-phosphate galactose phosphotransferase WbaP [Pluralibacter gergoviae]|uniref:undecaprenyl-phosphate galactose phosphotransferase WbaP n=1 Tax=Pluralibacter gergoviae TaxID=61647 RepID=UPI0019092B6F|nr:undecaprenyl-phosphate galactose phosphotransferase WbaP [Pluralibacter gergoviae]EKT9643558.1 undecaprenyl-phosphate galactose phosphotransferase WbaP [Pluralibacter gergoviae]EMD1656843.1 undecaprenyl-phosphate galactose phosphotransferase WbaP [Pluralibacter gergoviae]MBK4118577.1 undecaprenyl-phosphate galactose phosphotransferase WbaP [Pluralibacter gergoviae]